MQPLRRILDAHSLLSKCLTRYYGDTSAKRLKGAIDIRRSCTAVAIDESEDAAASWPAGSDARCRISIITGTRTYYCVCDSPASTGEWIDALRRVARRATLKGAIPEGLAEFGQGPSLDAATSGGRKSSASEIIRDAVPYSPPVHAYPPAIRVERTRRHIWRETITNNAHGCAAGSDCVAGANKTPKKIGIRVKHSICTQCRKRFHLSCIPETHCDCNPPEFGSATAGKRAPPVSGSSAPFSLLPAEALDDKPDLLLPGCT